MDNRDRVLAEQAHRICFVVPYIGTLPGYFPLWLNTCRHNPSVDFLLLTDDTTSYAYPENVKVRHTTLDELRRTLQRLFDFPICLDAPYKLCDFKVAYGEAFAGLLAGYHFWGHCDIDLFWGNIRQFITPGILDGHDRILTRGHCSLYRNNDTVSRYYRTLDPRGFQSYRDVFSLPGSRCFDEWGGHVGGGVSHIMKANGVSQYDEAILADLMVADVLKAPASLQFIVNRIDGGKSKGRVFELRDGSCVSHYWRDDRLHTEEYLYAHFQKRTPQIEAGVDPDHFLFAPGARVVKAEPVTRESIARLTRDPRLAAEWLRCLSRSVKRRVRRNAG